MAARQNTPNRGFTLLEVLLAIGLSVALLALLGSAINLYLIRVDSSRSTVEQAQLARGVLRLISDDVRNAAVLYEQDISSAEENASSQALFDVDEADQTPPDPTAEETDESTRPATGVTGDAASLQVDVLRVRPAYSMPPEAVGQPMQVTYQTPGVTTVRYLLSEQGLVRQQVTRDQSIQEELRGVQDAWNASSRVVAEEVAELRFRYFDGQQALEYWDLEEQGGASPLAVEIRIGLRPASAETDGQESQQSLRYYRVTAPLPAGLGGQEEDSSTAEEEEA